ncbi:MAG: chemotaxis response regulator protein-glutamate methylesterase [Methylovulum sp.]|jgi:two-component system chemotaxis response regulator CheB|nr:chemotaxis response regulator protein-glutamate methylesterase [Methylovulum sp.]MCF7999747.1 chemotaxis response regulator protein-glutamate methylesterase [Methylovulum sp.]
MINVLIVDDSAVVRQVLTEVLSKDPQIRVIATAGDPIIAKQKMMQEWPDVIVLDVEMPRMDGITFLKIIMTERPTPVVICSTLTEKGAETTLQAMSAGAVCYVTKPKLGLKGFLTESAVDLINSVKVAAQSRPKRFISSSPSKHVESTSPLQHTVAALTHTTEKIVAIGTSTGGTQALEVVLTALPRVSPGIVIVQHMPEKFTASFASRLNSLCAIEVREAKDRDRVIPGLALIAPGGLHMRLTRSGAYYHVNVLDGPPVNRHKPSVDVLFKSVANVAGRNALGIIMTGMGDDGARGLKEMHDAGAYTVAQDEASCVVFGMPKEAIKLGAADTEQPLGHIADMIMRYK